MSFWNPWDNACSSSVTTKSSAYNQANYSLNENPNESLSRLCTSEILNSLDCTNLSEKFTFLDDSCDQLLNVEAVKNYSPAQSNRIKQESSLPVSNPQIKFDNYDLEVPSKNEDYDAYQYACQQDYNLYGYNIPHMKFTPQSFYSDNSYSSVPTYGNNMNNLRPSSVLSTVSSNDYSSDFDSSISSTNTSDYKRYSPNTYFQPINNRYYTSNNNYPYYAYNDANASNLYNYNNQNYISCQNYVDPNVYYYNNLQFKANQTAKQMPVNSSIDGCSSMTRSVSNQSIISSNDKFLSHLAINKPIQLETTHKTNNTQTDIPDLIKIKQSLESTKKKANLNMNSLNKFKYPTTTKINPKIKINLQDIDLWMQFKEIGTEMVITKPGRRMFPVLRFSITGLDANKRYIVFVDILPTDENENRYKYHAKTGWVKVDKAEPHTKTPAYIHPDSPMIGSVLCDQIVSFHKIKLTNSITNADSMITLNSMHKYIPRLHLIEEGESITTFNLDDCVFFAVTSYQNDLVTKLKIQHNPYAKGFKEHVYKDSEKNQKGRRPEYDHDSLTRSNLISRPKLE